MNLATIVIATLAALLLIGLFVGFKRGFKQVGWKGLICFIAYEAFYFTDKTFSEKPFMPAIGQFDAVVMTRLVLMLASVVVGLLLYAFLFKLYRPSYYWTSKNPVYRKGPYEYEDDSAKETNMRLVWRNVETPNFYSRFIGGTICLLNVASILLALLSIVFVVFNYTSLNGQKFVQELLADEKISMLSTYACTSGLDFLFIAIIFNMACAGYKIGIYKTLFLFFERLGTLVALGVGGVLPFLLKDVKLIADAIALADKFVGQKLLAIPTVGPMLEKAVPVINQVVVAIVFAVVLVIVMKLLTFIFRMLAKSALKKKSDTVNGILGCVLYLALGVVLCALICLALYFLGTPAKEGANAIMGLEFMKEGSLLQTIYAKVTELVLPLIKK